MAIKARLLTAEELEKIPQPDVHGELVKGEIIEVISPEDTVEEVAAKVLDYLEAGTRLVWVIRPRTRTVTAYRSRADIQLLTGEDRLDGGDVLPGFSICLEEIFEG